MMMILPELQYFSILLITSMRGLYDLGLIASVGITTGDVFCGQCCWKQNEENTNTLSYSLTGDSVDLLVSARLMQKACADGGGSLLVQYVIGRRSVTVLYLKRNSSFCEFTVGEIRVKGKSLPVKIIAFRPSPILSSPPGLTPLPLTSGVKGPNVYRMIHCQQLQNAIVQTVSLCLGFNLCSPLLRTRTKPLKDIVRLLSQQVVYHPPLTNPHHLKYFLEGDKVRSWSR
jgi:hypothetical protein